MIVFTVWDITLIVMTISGLVGMAIVLVLGRRQ